MRLIPDRGKISLGFITGTASAERKKILLAIA
jgi:hypothetical protein